MVSTLRYDEEWNSDTDVAVYMKYPESGYGPILTYIHAIVHQVVCENLGPNAIHCECVLIFRAHSLVRATLLVVDSVNEVLRLFLQQSPRILILEGKFSDTTE